MLSDKSRKIIKIIMIFLMIIVIGIAVELFIEIFAFKKQDPSYEMSVFANHFSIGVALILIAVIAFLMPLLTKRKFSDDSKDNLMIIVSGLLLLSGVVAIFYSFIVGGVF